MPPVRLVVLREPLESKRPKRTSCPLARKPSRVKVPETESRSPTPSATGAPSVKWDQKPSELVPVAVMSNATDPGPSVRTVVERPLNRRRELFERSWFWLFASANVSLTMVAAAATLCRSSVKMRASASCLLRFLRVFSTDISLEDSPLIYVFLWGACRAHLR